MNYREGARYIPRGDITVVRAVLPNPHDDSRVLVMQRKPTSTKNPSLWELPGGKAEPGDPNLFKAVVREFEEETGFAVRLTEGLSLVDRYIITDGSDKHGQLYVAYAGVARWMAGSLVRGQEHIGDAWVDPSDIAEHGMEFTPQTCRAFQLYNNLTLGLEHNPDANTHPDS